MHDTTNDVGAELWLEFCGEEHHVRGRFGIGRAADLVVDDNPYLHRVVVVVEERDGTWWLRNVGSRIVVTVLDGDGHSSATVGPGSSCALVHERFLLRFRAGPVTYELGGTLGTGAERSGAVQTGGPGSPTLEWGRVDLNDDQRLLVVALCEGRLTAPADRWAALPSNRSAALRLGWSLSKFNRKLDHLCEKLDRVGVPGVHGDLGLLAADRRRVLVEHALEVGLVTPADLALLPGAA
jgi:hypothetical protein